MSTLLRDAAARGIKFEFGEATLANNTVEVTTKFNQIVFAAACFHEAPAAASQIYCDKTITSGAVTFADSAVAAKTFMYVLAGF